MVLLYHQYFIYNILCFVCYLFTYFDLLVHLKCFLFTQVQSNINQFYPAGNISQAYRRECNNGKFFSRRKFELSVNVFQKFLLHFESFGGVHFQWLQSLPQKNYQSRKLFEIFHSNSNLKSHLPFEKAFSCHVSFKFINPSRPVHFRQLYQSGIGTGRVNRLRFVNGTQGINFKCQLKSDANHQPCAKTMAKMM